MHILLWITLGVTGICLSPAIVRYTRAFLRGDW